MGTTSVAVAYTAIRALNQLTFGPSVMSVGFVTGKDENEVGPGLWSDILGIYLAGEERRSS